MAEEKKCPGGKKTEQDPQSVPKGKRICKNVGKVILWISGVIIALLLLILIFIDPLLHFGITKIGGALTGTRITLDEIELSFTRGDLKIVDLRVSNPEGYSSPALLELGAFYISLDKSSLMSEDITIKKINLHKLRVTADVNAAGKLNFLKVVENLTSTGSSASAGAMLYMPLASITAGPVSFSRFLGAMTPPATPAAGAASPRVWINDFAIEDVQFNWMDERKKMNIKGFGVSMQKLSGSLNKGNIHLQDLKIFNPDSFDKEHMLTLQEVIVNMSPETIYTPSPAINLVHVNGMDSCAEFNTAGDFNVLLLIESMQNALQPEMPVPVTADAPAKTQENQEDSGEKEEEEDTTADQDVQSPPESEPAKPVENEEAGPELEKFVLSSSSFTIYNDMVKLPITIPLALEKDGQTFLIDDVDVFAWLHEHAVKLRDLCLSVTDAKDLLFKFVDSSADAGVKLLDTTAKKGLELVNTTTKGGIELLDKTIKKGIDAVENVDKDGKKSSKALKKIINIFTEQK